MNQLNMNTDDFITESIDCIDPFETNLNENNKYLLNPIESNKTHTLVLDIDETLLSVRRWIDEAQINDHVLYNKTNKLVKVIKITKEVTLQYDDDGAINVYSFYFTRKQPYGQLTSSLDVGDRMDIGGRLASVKEVLTSYVTIFDGDNNCEVEINCLTEEYLQTIIYCDNQHYKFGKFSKPDLVYNNMYLVRFRCGLYEFFNQMLGHKHLEIILWTAAVRKVYTGLMNQVEQLIKNKLNYNDKIWTQILFRDNCTSRENGSYFKDLSLLGRNYNNLIMIDNISFNFQGFEYNGLPIQDYYGHINDDELHKLCSIMNDLMIPSTSNYDVRRILHHLAFINKFSTFKLDQMLRYLNAQNNESNYNKTPESPSMSTSTASNDDIDDIDIEQDIELPPSPIFEQDETFEIDMASEDNGADSVPTSLESSPSSSTSSSSASSNEDSDKHLDFYLFNLSPALDNNDIIDFQDNDQVIFDDVDPTLLFNQNYN